MHSTGTGIPRAHVTPNPGHLDPTNQITDTSLKLSEAIPLTTLIITILISHHFITESINTAPALTNNLTTSSYRNRADYLA